MKEAEIALLVITDGRREYLVKTLASAQEHLHGPITKKIIVNDAHGDEEFSRFLEILVPDWTVITADYKMGFGGAIQAGWNAVRKHAPECEYVFHLEGDFLFSQDIDLTEMIGVLESDPKLAQLVLMRQPWNESEKAAGGIIHQNPDWYEETGTYVKHNAFWSTNPGCYRVDIIKRGWPKGPESEGHFGIRLRAEGMHFGFYQAGKFDAPKVWHIGEVRAGTGY